MLYDFLKEQSSDVGCGGAGYPQKALICQKFLVQNLWKILKNLYKFRAKIPENLIHWYYEI